MRTVEAIPAEAVERGVRHLIEDWTSTASPSPGVVRDYARREERARRPAPARLPDEGPAPAPAWVAFMWVASCHQWEPAVPPPDLAPFVQLARSFGLYPEHGIPEHADYFPALVALAEPEFGALYRARLAYLEEEPDPRALSRRLLGILAGIVREEP